jgi:hypothetical protein
MTTAITQLIDAMKSDPQAANDIADNLARLEPGELAAILQRAEAAYAADGGEQS